MLNRKLFIIFGFLLALLWGTSNLKQAATRLQFEVFNEPVIVKVVDLPLCGRSNIIGVEYKEKKYNISINKNDCIQGKYIIGNVLEATYNAKLDEMNPNNFVGVYRLYMFTLGLIFICFLLYLFLSSKK